MSGGRMLGGISEQDGDERDDNATSGHASVTIADVASSTIIRGWQAGRKAPFQAPRDARRKKSIMASIYTPTSQHGRLRDVIKICETRINYRRPTTVSPLPGFHIRDMDAATVRPYGVRGDAVAHA